MKNIRYNGMLVLLLMVFLAMPALAVTQGEHTFAGGGAIIKSPVMEAEGRRWIHASSVAEVLSALKIESSYEEASALMAISPGIRPSGEPELGSAGDHPLRIVAGGRILRMPAMTLEGKHFVPMDSAEALLLWLGVKIEKDPAGGLWALTLEESAPRREPSPETPDIPGDPGIHIDKDTLDKAEKVREYLDLLREIFDRNKPSAGDLLKIQDGLINIGTGRVDADDLLKLGKKYQQAAVEIGDLVPPDEETREINDLGIRVFDKMKEMVDVSVDLMKLEQGFDNPGAVERFRRLGDEITRDGALFDRLVLKLREKYDMGIPK